LTGGVCSGADMPPLCASSDEESIDSEDDALVRARV
jgi:hypothetical protein